MNDKEYHKNSIIKAAIQVAKKADKYGWYYGINDLPENLEGSVSILIDKVDKSRINETDIIEEASQ